MFFDKVFWCPFLVLMLRRRPGMAPSGFLMCLRCGQCYLLEPALEKLNGCHIFHATVMSHCKMKEVLITLPTCLARFPPQLSKELANIRLDSQPMFLLFSNSCNVTLHKDFPLIFFSPYVLLKIGK